MSFQDRNLTCRDCGQTFIFTSGEQDFYASRGLTNDPSRCKDCRAIRRGQTGSFGSTGGHTREMFDVICASCGKATQVPFQPVSGRPVYCSDCFAQQPHRSYR